MKRLLKIGLISIFAGLFTNFLILFLYFNLNVISIGSFQCPVFLSTSYIVCSLTDSIFGAAFYTIFLMITPLAIIGLIPACIIFACLMIKTPARKSESQNINPLN